MTKNKPTFAFIGKPNNGKSSIISALTFDDRIEVSKEIGTTTIKSRYDYIYNDELIYSCYDTPGFEKAKTIWNYIKQNKQSNFNINVLQKFIGEYVSHENMHKDIEILKAIVESEFIVFVINISENYNQNVIGYELEILKFINKPVLVLFNKIGDIEYGDNWKKKLYEYEIKHIYEFNPLDGSYSNIQEMFKNLYTIAPILEQKQHLDKIINAHRRRYDENTTKSALEIARMIAEILLHQAEYKIFGEEASQEDKDNALKNYQEEIYSIEKKTKKLVENFWGYYQVKIKDERAELDSKESVESSGLSTKNLIILGGIVGGSFGMSLSALLGGLDFGVITASGVLVGGGVGKWQASKLYLDKFVSNKIIHSINKKNYNVIFILIKRSLEHLHKLLENGHASRKDIVIDKDNSKWKFNENWEFSKSELKNISEISKEIVDDKNIDSNLDKLSNILKIIIQKEIK
ncbi:MAG: DUF3482 domain-containing protein [Arcobacteraceae bacterium]